MLENPVELYKLSMIVLFTFIVIMKTGGISFLFRVFIRIFKLSYNNSVLQKSENTAYDLQLFNILYGANVRSINDAKIIQSEMNAGRIQRFEILFSSIYGFIGDRKRSNIFYSFFIAAIFIFTLFSIASFYIISGQKIGYYRISIEDQVEFISLNYITDDYDLTWFDKSSCRQLLEHSTLPIPSARFFSCSQLLKSDEDGGHYLSKKIEENDFNYRLFFWGGIFYLLYSVYLSIGLFNFHRVNKYILKIKHANE
ncbi:hypothetical protein [Hafnia paralvei]|uniref:hypothetical protein n=1 Tax=Hafnia paralvei TaxID=546367 RepID=UPI001034E579|nr:hypothetical protein [Hafnia paralvei]TBM30347.1 hypothetical protein EYY85_05010 [Hafnia paralvei]